MLYYNLIEIIYNIILSNNVYKKNIYMDLYVYNTYIIL